jgi:hypothetical protein
MNNIIYKTNIMQLTFLYNKEININVIKIELKIIFIYFKFK